MYCDPARVKSFIGSARQVKALILDVDGVFTDGHIIYNIHKEETKFYNAQDGLGIKLAASAGLITGIISARESDAIRHRAQELGIDIIFLGRYDKLNAYKTLKKKMKLKDREICFMGDDLPDIPVLQKVGLPVAVQNAAPMVKAVTGLETRRSGGKGAIRETVEFILFAQGRLESETHKMIEHL